MNSSDLKFEIGHVLCIDIVGYSKGLINEQSESLQKLKEIVRGTEQFRIAEAEGKLLRLPTGDGGALVFRNSPEAPVLCAMEIAKALKSYSQFRVRMGIHSGPVNEISDLNEQANIAGAGVNIAQRVMDCGDAGHILLSKHVAEDLQHYPRWEPHLHELGECEVKHGVRVSLVNFYTDEVGNPAVPEKFRKTVASSAGSTRRKSVKSYLVPGIISLAVLAILSAVFGPRVFRSRNQSTLTNTAQSNNVSTSPVSAKSIAVLPFENLSSDKENAYFAEGIQDEVLTRLAKIGALKVISRTSTSHFASSPQNLPDIARQLGVANILEGSVQKAREAVHVNVQLIRAATDDHLWAESYDRKLDDIFAVEKEVAQNIAATLNAKLTGAEEQAIAQKPTSNQTAYEAYLRGNTQFWEINEQSLLEAEKSYREAINLDPQFAIAWAALARLHAVLFWIDDTTAARRAAAEQALNEAQRLQPDAVETKVSQGYFGYMVKHDLRGTVDLMEQAHQTWPNNAEVLQLLSFAAARLGEWNKSDDAIDRAVVLNPRDLATRRWTINNRLDTRDFVSARSLTDEALQVWPDELNLLGLKAESFQALGQLDEAQALISRMKPHLKDYDALNVVWYQAKLRRDPAPAIKILEPLAQPTNSGFDWIFQAAELGDLQALAGDRASSESTFAQIRDRAGLLAREQPENTRYLPSLAQALSHLGEKDAALRVIEKLMKLRAGDYRSQPASDEQRARILSLFGEKDQAIEILQRLLQTRYSGWATTPLTPALLRLDPDFDPLRGDPRFQKLCQDQAN